MVAWLSLVDGTARALFFALAFGVADAALVVSITDECVFFEGMGTGADTGRDDLLSFPAAGLDAAGALFAVFLIGFGVAALTDLTDLTGLLIDADLAALTGAFDFVAATGFLAGATGFFAAACLDLATGLDFAGVFDLVVAAFAAGFAFATGFARATTLADLALALDFTFDFAISVLTL